MLFPFRQDPVVNSHMFSVAYVHEPFDYDCAAGHFSLRIYMATFAVHHCVQMFSSRWFIGGDDWAMIEGRTLSPAHFSVTCQCCMLHFTCACVAAVLQ